MTGGEGGRPSSRGAAGLPHAPGRAHGPTAGPPWPGGPPLLNTRPMGPCVPSGGPHTFFEKKVCKKAFCKASLCLWGCRPAGRLGNNVRMVPAHYGPAATAAPHQAACVRRESVFIFVEVGPSGPRVGQKQILILPAGRILLSDRRASPVTGVRGKGDYERPLREGAHRSHPPAILWFLSDRSERNIVSLNYKSRQYPLPSPDTPPEPDDPKSASCGPDQRPPGSPSAPRRSAG